MNNLKITQTFNLNELTGPLPFSLDNDAFFHFLLQENENILRKLLCSVLNKQEHEILSLTILNPIEYGSYISAKMLVLDLSLHMNDNTYINLEMQVTNHYNWADRDLTYASRRVDHLSAGEDYRSLQPVIQIAFLDYTLFPDYPEFHAVYMIENIKTHHIFTDKLCFHVIELNHTNLATDEDKAQGIDHWAHMFKAKTWEDLKLLADKDSVFENVAQNVKQFSSDYWFAHVIDAREDAMRNENDFRKHYETEIAIRDQEIASKDQEIASKDQEIASKDQEIASKDQVLSLKDARIAELEKQLMNLQK